jgi:hypothetical protein
VRIDQYQLGSRTININTDSLFGIVTGQGANIPISVFLQLVPSFAFSGGTTSNRPASPIQFQQYFDTTLGLPVWWTGSKWVNAAGVQS